MQGNEAFANVLGDELRKVALVVSIMSPSETSFQLDDERNQARRDLEARGVRVLPEGDLPVRHPLQFRQAVNEALAQCDLSVHMVAPDRSLVLPGEVHDTVYLQNQIAAERCTRSDLTRLIWIPEGLTPSEMTRFNGSSSPCCTVTPRPRRMPKC